VKVVVVGLGPAGTDLLLPAARAELERVPVRFVRTARHPAVADLAAEGIDLTPLDHHYEQSADLDGAYAGIVAELVAAARAHGEVLYAVPGSPATAERTPALLAAAGAQVVVVPGLSFAELAWNRLAVDPLDGAHVVDARRFAVDAAGLAGPLLVAQCDSRLLLSDVKLVLLEHLPADTPVVALHHLGLPEEEIRSVALEDLDRDVEPDHLTSLFVDTGRQRIASELATFYALVERLRGPGGCPWDAEQTHRSLARHTLEEAYEVVEAIEQLPFDAPAGDVDATETEYGALADELGDLLFQVFIHSVLAREAGAFTLADVARGIHDKLVRRHPHVFGDVVAVDADAVVTNWEQIKKAEKGAASVVDGIPDGLPALLYATKLLRKAESVGIDPVALVRDGRAARLEALDPAAREEAVGELLAAAVVAARRAGVDPEVALRGWAARAREHVRRIEQAAP
jgi:tetrapyrrole methylase family protein/MazG family protein